MKTLQAAVPATDSLSSYDTRHLSSRQLPGIYRSLDNVHNS